MEKNIAIAIIGGGFAGTAVAIQLINQSKEPLDLFLVEKSSHIGKGTAFGTENPKHLLNVRAGNMSAFPSDPDHFYRWLLEHQDSWRKLNDYYASLPLTPQHFYPRHLFGMYLEHLWQEAIALAKKKEIRLSFIHAHAIAANLHNDGQIIVHFQKEQAPLSCDYLVLATGIAANKPLSFETPALLQDCRYIRNLWDPPTESILNRNLANNHRKDETVLIVGTGLTMVDAIMGLTHLGYRGNIVAVSPKGILPTVHAEKNVADLSIQMYSAQLLPLYREVRKLIAENGNWRSIIDGLRPFTPQLWQAFSLTDKRRFLRHLFTLWNKHRHRMSPESGQLLNALQKEGKLSFLAGSIRQIDQSQVDSLKVLIRLSKTKEEKVLEVHHLINCAGPDYRITKQNNFLLNDLHRQKLISWDKLEMGLASTPKGHLEGIASKKIYALGSLLFGDRFETTAAPEIRQQAEEIARSIILNLCQAEEPFEDKV